MMSRLFSTTCVPAFAGQAYRPYLRRYTQEEDGFVTIFAVAIIGLMVLMAGISFDMQRNEMERVRIQNTADRAVLAAADLDQTLDPAEVVRDYFAKAGIPQRANSLSVSEGLNFRTVSVNSDSVTPTNFMSMLGIDELPLRSSAEAEERVNNVEISMVLDISGSMSSGAKMVNLRDAASTFVDAVINPSTEDLVSISLIPYSEHVSAGPALMQKFNVNWNNPYSHCIDFADTDFNTTRLRRDKQYDQVQHFQWGFNGSTNDVSTPVCPTGAHEDIVAFSQDTNALKYKIGQLVPRGSTSIFAGMKWATGLLDPDFNTINADLSQSNVTDPVFAARPAAFDDPTTLKTVVLMTDGENHYSYRINGNYYANESHALHWSKYNLNWYLKYYVNSYYHNQFRYLKYWPDKGDSLLDNICNAAKQKSIVIWSIGFEVNDHGADVMRKCASTPSHFFRVEGVEIKEAFSAIARQINQLRLTQ